MTVPDRTRVLFVCTGNICRSAFAEVMARSVFAERSFMFSSAGTHAIPGSPATRNMQTVALERGLDLSNHTATPLDRCNEPDIVFGMEQHHLIAAREHFPGLDASRIRLLDHPMEIPDPYGADLDDYRSTADRFERVFEARDLVK